MHEKFNGRFDYSAQILDGNEICDLSDDYTLPDYMPAVGRVISCSASVAPPALYSTGGTIEYAGGIRYRLLYESADDKSVWCAELPAEYDLIISSDRAPIPADHAELSGLACATAENVTARITAPRRLTVKSRVKLATPLHAKAQFELNMRGDLKNSDDIKVLEGRAQCGMTTTTSSKPEILTDKITRAEAGLSPTDEIRIISSRGDVMLSQIQPFDGGADCKGEINVSLLICKDGEYERPRRLTRKIPFSIPVSFESDLPASAKPIGYRGYGSAPSVTSTVDEDGINLEANLLLCAEAAAVTSFNYVKDLYSRSADCETSAVRIALLTPVHCQNRNATVSASADLSALGADSGIKLCDIRSAIIPDVSAELNESGRIVINGKQKITAITDNGAELLPIEFESEFKYTADTPDATPANPKISVIASVSDCKGRLDGTRLECDCELSFAITVSEQSEITALGEVNLMPTYTKAKSSSCIRVCYPVSGETLWDIAKKYRVDVDTIAEKNSLDTVSSPDDPSSLAKASFLII